MASIFGAINFHTKHMDEMGQSMFAALASRGGDTKTLHQEDALLMGLRSDPAAARAAMVSNHNRSVIAMVEGEIYNAKELHALLSQRGIQVDPAHVFDMIIPLYELFGKDFPRHLNGVFVIALWDNPNKNLYLVRDHLGSHSLFYILKDGRLMFASTIEALLSTGFLPREISLPALNTYLSSTSITPPNTPIKDILCLRPGSMVVIDSNRRASDIDYWQIKAVEEDYHRGMDDFAEELRALILDAIKIRAAYGGNYGSLLSGGVDTGIVTAELAKLNDSARKKLPVFSIAFAELVYSDAALQQVMCDRYPLDPHVAVLTPKEFASILPKAVAQLDCPVNDVACVGMYKAFQMAKESACSAVFEGEAADEIFYTGHAHAEREFQRYIIIPTWLRRLMLGSFFRTMSVGQSKWDKGFRLLFRLGLPDNERRLIGLPSFYKHSTPILRNVHAVKSEDPLSMGKKYLAETVLHDHLNIYYYGLLKTFLADDLLFKNERMAAAHGIVNRTPFIDYRLFELGYKIPQALKIKAPTATDDGTKLVYKKAIQGLIPDEILLRKKTRGFSQPSAVWYRAELKDFVHDTLFGPSALYQNYLNREYLFRLYSDHASGKANYDYLLNSVLILELWLQAFLKQPSSN